jgi:UDP-3-O-[3-hydroxymyristoyl] glucosamine N-acyltransferase
MMPMAAAFQLSELAKLVDGTLEGDDDIEITGAGTLDQAQHGDIAFVESAELLPRGEDSQASALIVPQHIGSCRKPLIRAANPRFAFGKVLAVFSERSRPQPGVHPSAVLGRNVSLGERVSIGAMAVVWDNVAIGDDTIIHPQAYIGEDVRIGRHCEVFAQAVLYDRVEVGDRVIIHASSVIGADGFGYTPESGAHVKMPQIGNVILEDDVEIGANSCVDRATVASTRIGAGTKIDNLVHVAHNCQIGKHCLICAQVGISGSTIIGDRVIMGGQVGVNDHVTIGEGAVFGGQAGVISDVEPGQFYSGYPARPHAQAMRMYAAMRRLPQLERRVRQLEQLLARQEDDKEG